MMIRNGRKIGHGGLDLGPADPPMMRHWVVTLAARHKRTYEDFKGVEFVVSGLSSEPFAIDQAWQMASRKGWEVRATMNAKELV